MAEVEFIVEPVNLDSLRETIAALTGEDRLAMIELWARLHGQLGRGASGWVGHWIDQRCGEIRGVRAVELGPSRMLARREVAVIDRTIRSLLESPLTTFDSRRIRVYLDAVLLTVCERAVKPSAAELSFRAETRRSVHAPRHGTAREVAPPRPPEESKSNPEGGNRG